MKSPFAGMDPYIEGCGMWKDFHNGLMAEFHRAISDELPPGYVARTGTRSYITLADTDTDADAKREHHFEPDVSISAKRDRETTGAAAVLAEPEGLSLRAFVEDTFDERFIDIFELDPERRLVTSLEVLSPSNKVQGSQGWKLYLRKRQALLRGRANLVELDLLRGGKRMPMLDPLPNSPYYVLVARREKAPLCRVWPASFDRPLPAVRVPLAKPDPDIVVPLQPLVEMIYKRSRYQEDIDYRIPPVPPFTDEEAAKRAKPAARAKPKKRAK